MRRLLNAILVVFMIGAVYSILNEVTPYSGGVFQQASAEAAGEFEDVEILFGEDWGLEPESQVDWSYSPDDLGETSRINDAERPHLRIYRRQDEQLRTVNEVAIASVSYLYFEDELVGVEILPVDARSSSAGSGLREFFEELYGKSSSVSFFSLARKWEGDQTDIRLDRPAFGDTLLTIRHKTRSVSAEEHLAGLSKSERSELLVDTLIQHAEPISYDDLARYYDTHQGRAVSYTGRIVQKARDDEWRVYIDGQSELHIYVEYKGDQDPRLLEGDTIHFVGIAEGRYTYRSVLGGEITVPRISAYLVERVP